MADRTRLNANVTQGDDVWTEEITSLAAKVQGVKLVLGGRNADGGNVSNANPLPMRDAPLGLLEAPIDIITTGVHDVVTGVSGQIIKIWKMVLWSNGDQTLSIRDGATPLMGDIDLAQGGQLKLERDADPWFTLSANAPFNLFTSSTARLAGRVYYTRG